MILGTGGTGLVTFLLLVSLPLTWVLIRLVRVRYRSVIAGLMQRPSRAGAEFAMPPPRARSPGPIQLVAGDLPPPRIPRWRLGMLYGAAGLAHAVVATGLMIATNEIAPSFGRIAVSFACFVLPAVPFSMRVMGLGPAWWLGTTALILAGLTAVDPPLLFAAVWFGIFPMMISLLIGGRGQRTMALSLFAVVITTLAALLGSLDLAVLAGERFGDPAALTMLAAAPFLAVGLGWLAAWVVGRIAASSSDLMLQGDTVWLLVSIWEVILLGLTSVTMMPLGLVPFVAYRAVLAIGGRLARPDGTAQMTLFLRVFGQRAQKEAFSAGHLLDWRRDGPVALIGAEDLATDVLDAPQLATFLSGQTARLFIDAPEDLDRLERRVLHPATDGLYPVEDVYCHADTWQPVVSRLMHRAGSIVLDARGFSETNAGLAWEINEMLRRKDPAGIRVLIDADTDRALLERLVHAAWSAVPQAGSGAGSGAGAVPARLALLHV